MCVKLLTSLISDSDVDDVAAVSVFRFTPVNSTVAWFHRLYVAAGGGSLDAPARSTLG